MIIWYIVVQYVVRLFAFIGPKNEFIFTRTANIFLGSFNLNPNKNTSSDQRKNVPIFTKH